MAGTGYSKSFARFLPLTSRTREECERHYVDVHFAFARRMLAAQPNLITYHTGVAVAEYDIAGGWSQYPRAWRFVMLRLRAGQAREASPEIAELIAQDHRNCLRDLRSCKVSEDVVLDRRSGQTVLVKYLFEFDRHPDTPADVAASAFRVIVDAVVAAADSAQGLRLVVANDVLSESATEAIDEPGQRSLGRPLPETTKQGYLELYFDDVTDAEEWFAREEIRSLLQDPSFAVARGYRIEERCGVDKR